MSGPYDHNNSGALFKNDKQGIETRADYRGKCEINRVEFYVNAWVNTDRNGKKYLSLKFQPKAAADVAGGVRNPPPIKSAPPDFDDGIPL